MGSTRWVVAGNTPRIRVVHVENENPLTPVDISLCDALVIRFEKPDGTRVDKTGIISTTGLDGAQYYDMTAVDTATSGLWKVQGRAHWADGKVHNTKEGSFFIYPGLVAPTS